MKKLSLLAILLLVGPLFAQISVNDWIIVNGKVNEKVVLTANESKEVTWDSDDFPPERSVIVGQTYIVFPIAPGEYRIKQIQWDTKKLVKIKVIITGTVIIPDPKKPDIPKPPDIKPDVPIVVPDKDPDFTNRISGMYSKDVALSKGDAVMLNQLKLNYQQGYKDFMSSATNKELMDKQAQLNQKLVGPAASALPSVRTEIGEYVKTRLGTKTTDPPTAAGPVWLQIIDSLKRTLDQ